MCVCCFIQYLNWSISFSTTDVYYYTPIFKLVYYLKLMYTIIQYMLQVYHTVIHNF